MANRKAAVKSLRVDKRKHAHNMAIRRELKKTVKKFLALVAAKSTEEAKKLLVKVSSLLDKAAKKNIIHKNTASRKKSRLAKQLLKSA